MLELKSLTFNNIRCFDTEQTISLEGRDKLIQVDGRNENTGGSSGAGKTTVFLALDYLLGINDIPVTTLQSRLTKETISTSGEFLLDGKPLTIKRSKKHGLSIDLDGDVVSGNSKLSEEKLDDIIGIPRKIFKKMVHKKQKDGGFFLSMTAKEMYEFLVEMLSLGRYIKESEVISLGIKDHTQKIESLESEVFALQEASKSLLEAQASKIKPEVDLEALKGQIEALSTQSDGLKLAIEKINSLKEQEIGNLSPPLRVESVETDHTALDSLKSQLTLSKDNHTKTTKTLNDVEQKILIIQQLIPKTKEIGLKCQELSKQKEHLESTTCPTCKQKWSGQSALDEIERIKSERSELINQALLNKREIDKQAEYKANSSQLHEILIKISSQTNVYLDSIADEKSKLDNIVQIQANEYLLSQATYNDKIKSIEQKHTVDLDKLKTDLNSANNQLALINNQYETGQKAILSYNTEMNSITIMVADKLRLIDKAKGEIEQISGSILVSQESNRLIKAYVLHIFQETLDLIGETATEFLSAIPNMQTSTIYFEGCRETKTGTIKDEVSAVINMDGNNSIPIKSLSGGEKTSIDLAVDLAVIDIIETKTNKGANFFVIDEPFDGLDSVCKENCLEILKQVDTNKKIIMVDHSSELKEMIADVITVVKNKESSKVVEQNVV